MKEAGYVASKSRGSFDREGLVTLAGQFGEVAVVCPIGAEIQAGMQSAFEEGLYP